MYRRPRRALEHKYYTHRSHQWTRFELHTMFSLICHGAHLESSRGTKKRNPGDPQKIAYLTFTTALNKALHGEDYEMDIEKEEVMAMLDDMIKERGHVIGKGGIIERWAGNGKITRTLRLAWERGEICGRGGLQARRDERKALRDAARDRIRARQNRPNPFAQAFPLKRERITQHQPGQPRPLDIVQPQPSPSSYRPPVPAFTPRTTLRPRAEVGPSWSYIDDEPDQSQSSGQTRARTNRPEPHPSSPTTVPPFTASANASTTEQPRKQKRPGIAKYGNMKRSTGTNPTTASGSTESRPSGNVATTPQYQRNITATPNPYNSYNPAPTPQYHPGSGPGGEGWGQTPQYQSPSAPTPNPYYQSNVGSTPNPYYRLNPAPTPNAYRSITPHYQPNTTPTSNPYQSAPTEDEMFAAFNTRGAPTGDE